MQFIGQQLDTLCIIWCHQTFDASSLCIPRQFEQRTITMVLLEIADFLKHDIKCWKGVIKKNYKQALRLFFDEFIAWVKN